MRFIEVIKEIDNELYENVRFSIVNSGVNQYELTPEEVNMIEFAINENDESIEEIIDMLKYWRTLDGEVLEVFECFQDHFDNFTALKMVYHDEYSIYENASEYVDNWFWNCYGDLDKKLCDEFGSYVGSYIYWSIDFEELGKRMIRDSESTYLLSNGAVIDLYL